MKRIAFLAPLVVLAASCSDQEVAGPRTSDGSHGRVASVAEAPLVTVMSRNIYLGAEISPMLSASSPTEVAILAAQMYGQVVANDFPRRAEALADEIASALPDFVGVQEVATFRLQVPGDYLIGNPTPATHVTFDYLALLLDALASRGLEYDAVAVQQGMDIEVPMALSATLLADVRMTIHDVILVRRDITVLSSGGGTFQAKLSLPIAGGLATLVIPRGWTTVDALIGGRSIRFVEAHLEAFHTAFSDAQAQELAGILRGFDSPTIVVGDFNSRPDGTRGAAYDIIRAEGFVDAWSQANPGHAGYTCCHDGTDLRTTERPLDERLDFVLVRDRFTRVEDRIVGTVDAWLVGEEPADLAAYGLWPSDHAGVVAALRLPLGHVAGQ